MPYVIRKDEGWAPHSASAVSPHRGAEGCLSTLHKADLPVCILAGAQSQAAIHKLASDLLASCTARQDEGAGCLQDISLGGEPNTGAQVVAGGAGILGGDGGQDLDTRGGPVRKKKGRSRDKTGRQTGSGRGGSSELWDCQRQPGKCHRPDVTL